MPVITLKPSSGSLIQLDVVAPATVRNVQTALRPFLTLNQRDGIVICETFYDPHHVLNEDETYGYLVISFRDLVPRVREDFFKTVNVNAVLKGTLDLFPFVTNSFSFLEDHFFHLLPVESEVQYVDNEYYTSCLAHCMIELEKCVNESSNESNESNESSNENIFDALVNLYRVYTTMYRT